MKEDSAVKPVIGQKRLFSQRQDKASTPTSKRGKFTKSEFENTPSEDGKEKPLIS